MPVTLDELTVADAADRWRDCGFSVEGDTCMVGATRIRFSSPLPNSTFVSHGDTKSKLGWSLSGLGSLELDGLPTARSERPPPPAEPPKHPNGVTSLDHVVAISSDLDRTVEKLVAAGLDLRRVREEPTPAGAPRQAFFRLGSVILEVVQEPPEATERAGGDRPAFFWGLAFAAPDLERTVAFLGDRVSDVRPAVQPGRRIATLRRGAGLALPVALITPPSPRQSPDSGH